MEKKKISVFVAGQRFNIITDEDENYVRELASRVDARISSLVMSGNMQRERAAVLAALDLADDGEKEKRNLNEVREQIKDYLSRVESLTDENAKLTAEMSKLKLSSEALADARKTIAEGEKEREALKKQVFAMREQIELMQKAADEAAKAEPGQAAAVEQPAGPAQDNKAEDVTAEDDLFFDIPREEPVKPAPRKEKKNRHDHSHVNPYKQQHMQKQGEQKGYTQQRQYSLFDTNE